jgi:hypothetical protein
MILSFMQIKKNTMPKKRFFKEFKISMQLPEKKTVKVLDEV